MNASRLLLFLPLFSVLSCSSPLYYPAIIGSYVPGVLTLPPSEKTTSSPVRYIMLDGAKSLPSNNGERNVLFRGHGLSVRSGKYYAANTGFFVHGGSYYVDDVGKYRGEHSFFGGGLEFNGGIHYPFGPVDVGFGMYAGGTAEFGDYTDFRHKAHDEGLAENDTDDILPMLAVYPVVRYHASNRTSVAAQCALGLPGFLSPSVTIQHDDYAIWFYLMTENPNDAPVKDTYFSLGIGRAIR